MREAAKPGGADVSRIRVVIAGYGYIAHHHARAVRVAEGMVLVGVMGRDPEKRKAFATQYGVETTYATASEVAGDPGVDAVVVALPNALHASVSVAMMEQMGVAAIATEDRDFGVLPELQVYTAGDIS